MMPGEIHRMRRPFTEVNHQNCSSAEESIAPALLREVSVGDAITLHKSKKYS